jgi:hypothetical protein
MGRSHAHMACFGLRVSVSKPCGRENMSPARTTQAGILTHGRVRLEPIFITKNRFSLHQAVRMSIARPARRKDGAMDLGLARTEISLRTMHEQLAEHDTHVLRRLDRIIRSLLAACMSSAQRGTVAKWFYTSSHPIELAGPWRSTMA